MEGFFDSEQLEFRDHLRRWVDERLKPRAEQLDRTGELARDLFEELGSLGYFGIMYPERYGGLGAKKPHTHFSHPSAVRAAGNNGVSANGLLPRGTPKHTHI